MADLVLGIILVLVCVLLWSLFERWETSRRSDKQCRERHEIERSVELLLTGLDIDNREDRVSKARSLTNNGDHVAAVNVWKEMMLQEDSEDCGTWFGLADALSMAGHVERAQQCRQKAEAMLAQERSTNRATLASKPSLSRPVSNYLSEDDERGMSTGSGHPVRYQSAWDDEDEEDEEEDG